jgi:hypothetical protein
MRKRFNLFIGENTLQALKYFSRKDDIAVSEIIRTAIREHLTAVKEKAQKEKAA